MKAVAKASSQESLRVKMALDMILCFFSEFGKTFAQVPMEQKAQVSHRGIALRQVAEEMDKILEWIDINMPRFERVPCKE